MKYTLQVTNRFKKSVKLCGKRGLPLDELWSVVDKLVNGIELDEKYKAHPLVGNYSNHMECHIKPDWLLIWKTEDEKLTLLLVDTGSHSDLFN